MKRSHSKSPMRKKRRASLDARVLADDARTFEPDDLPFLERNNIPLEIAVQYPQDMDVDTLIYTYLDGILPDHLRKYGNRYDALLAVKYGITPEVLAQYSDRFEKGEKVDLARKKVPASEAKGYPTALSGDGIIRLFQGGVSSVQATKHSNRFSVTDMFELAEEGIDLDCAAQYSTELSADHIRALVKKAVTPDQLLRYNPRFGALGSCALALNEVSTEDADAYDPRFTLNEILSMDHVYVTAKKARLYSERFSGEEIAILGLVGFNPEKIPLAAQEMLFDYLRLIAQYVRPRMLEHDFIAVGTTAVVISRDGYALKFAPNLVNEFRLLHKVKKANKEEPENIVRVYRLVPFINPAHQVVKLSIGSTAIRLEMDVEDGGEFSDQEPQSTDDDSKFVAIAMDYIKGESLERVLDEEGVLPADKVFKYGEGVCNGILELRRAGLYHRDIHPRNIIIRYLDGSGVRHYEHELERIADIEERGRCPDHLPQRKADVKKRLERLKDSEHTDAVIIDLGAATEDPDSRHPWNRAYGGNNDLISLGQLMYRMAVGHNLFNEGPGFSCYSDVKSGIKTKREEVYAGEQAKKEMLAKVQREVKDSDLAEIITRLLDDDLWTQPSLEKVKAVLEFLEGPKLKIRH